jgi:hypothetical protein
MTWSGLREEFIERRHIKTRSKVAEVFFENLGEREDIFWLRSERRLQLNGLSCVSVEISFLNGSRELGNANSSISSSFTKYGSSAVRLYTRWTSLRSRQVGFYLYDMCFMCPYERSQAFTCIFRALMMDGYWCVKQVKYVFILVTQLQNNDA